MSGRAAVRAVVDSNLLVRGILRRSPGSAAVRLVTDAGDGRFQLVLSEHILEEVRKTLRRPKVRQLVPGLSTKQLDDLVDALRKVGELVAGNFAVDLLRDNPKDDPIVACALEGDAGYLVTDDSELRSRKVLRVAGYRPVRIVSEGLFLRLLRRGDG